MAQRLQDFTALRALMEKKIRQLDSLKQRPGGGTASVRAGVLISPGYQFGPDAMVISAFCYARDETIWASALDRVVKALDGLKAR